MGKMIDFVTYKAYKTLKKLRSFDPNHTCRYPFINPFFQANYSHPEKRFELLKKAKSYQHYVEMLEDFLNHIHDN